MALLMNQYSIVVYRRRSLNNRWGKVAKNELCRLCFDSAGLKRRNQLRDSRFRHRLKLDSLSVYRAQAKAPIFVT